MCVFWSDLRVILNVVDLKLCAATDAQKALAVHVVSYGVKLATMYEKVNTLVSADPDEARHLCLCASSCYTDGLRHAFVQEVCFVQQNGKALLCTLTERTLSSVSSRPPCGL